MFFRRRPPAEKTLQQRMDDLRAEGFTVRDAGTGHWDVRRGRCAAVVETAPDASVRVARMGVLVRGEIGALIDGGYQKFLATPTGSRRPALATDLKELHDFQEDLFAGLGIKSLYNVSLGTVCDSHAYDRLLGRP